MPRNVQATTQLHSSHTLAKNCSKFSKLGFFNILWIENSQMCNLDLEKAEEPVIKLLTSTGPWKKQENYRKTSASLTTLKPLTVWITTSCEKYLKRWEYQTTLPVFWETCMRAKKQQLEPNMEQLTGSKLGKEHTKALYFHPAYVIYMHSHCCWDHSLAAQRLKRLPGMQETRVQSLGREDPLEKEMATHTSTLAWRIPWTEEPVGLQSTVSQRVRHN